MNREVGFVWEQTSLTNWGVPWENDCKTNSAVITQQYSAVCWLVK